MAPEPVRANWRCSGASLCPLQMAPEPVRASWRCSGVSPCYPADGSGASLFLLQTALEPVCSRCRWLRSQSVFAAWLRSQSVRAIAVGPADRVAPAAPRSQTTFTLGREAPGARSLRYRMRPRRQAASGSADGVCAEKGRHQCQLPAVHSSSCPCRIQAVARR